MQRARIASFLIAKPQKLIHAAIAPNSSENILAPAQLMTSRSRLFTALACLLVLTALYGLLGFFQAIMLYTEERALKNANIWGSMFVIAAVAAVFSFRAARVQTESAVRFRMARQFFSLVTLAAAIWFVFPVFSDLMAIDSCLDSGGSFDHLRSVCDLAQSHLSMSLFARQGFRLVMALVLVLLASLLWRSGRPIPCHSE